MITETSRVAVLDYGSQYTQLIVRRLRQLGVYAFILPSDCSIETIQAEKAHAIVLSGGPNSVYAEDAPPLPTGLLELGLPILAICYGMQRIALELGAEVKRSDSREYGRTHLASHEGELFAGVRTDSVVWMSHGDSLQGLPAGFEILATTADTPVAAMGDVNRQIYGLQFHPEVQHSQQGTLILENFLKLAQLEPNWQPQDLVGELIQQVRQEVGDARVLLGISGGVDSSTLALLLQQALGDKLEAVFVDHGLLRAGERQEVEQALSSLGGSLHVVDAEQQFLEALAGVSDPEQKRKIIGREFINVFQQEAKRLQAQGGAIEFLAQGTLYPDVVESAGGHGAANIKSHHNVGGLPEQLGFRLLEPFRTFFKDEVRVLAEALGLPETIRLRHPFPGPGLAIRCLGDISQEKLTILKKVDKIFIAALHEFQLYQETWQALAVLTPLRSVGVMGDERSYNFVVALRAVSSVDGMTADWTRLPHDFLAEVSNRIVNRVDGVSRVVYDITSKPPGTIEWE